MTDAITIEFYGHAMLADVSGALYWGATATLIVADLHFEKASAFAQRRGLHLPPYDTRETLACLRLVLDRYRPTRVICLGDSFHDRHAFARMAPDDREQLERLTSAQEWVWITGNHDPHVDERVSGTVMEELTQHGLTFRHEAAATASGEISGHYHPKAALSVESQRLSGKCFAFDERRLIMPAFGAFTGGLNVLDRAFGKLLANDFTVAMIGRHRISRLPSYRLAI